ncbi:SH3 domain-containing protein [Solilutibacter silvestris]|uniref:SH3b1-type SH3 domain-containing protein n=1 Tax=Solilutibacter silvestris TaxID=1645665 RepID=A0A2K1PY91_9GAMM|nr:SH3 domain-containing protein [Lysobacter silvestris]PNS07751.1 SH3b1-type SH3 domain-containing protein [Lysobacter silvestris]
MRNRHLIAGLFAAMLVAYATPAPAPTPAVSQAVAATAPRNGSAGLQVPGIAPEQLHADYWLARSAAADRIRLDVAQVAALDAEQFQRDPTFNRLDAFPDTLDGTRIRALIEQLAKRPSALLAKNGNAITSAQIDGWMADRALDNIPAQVKTRWAIVTRRADLRTFPTDTRVFRNAQGIRERIDRFQESALFPGTPVAVLHASRDGEWLFVVSPTYKAWMRREPLAYASRAEVLAFARDATQRVIAPNLVVDGRQLDMSTPVALDANGKAILPVRGNDGGLAQRTVTLPTGSSVNGALPYSERNLLTQAFRLLGEPYGWGHADGTRDCSGFVSDVYRSVGVQLARNTGDQRDSPVLQTQRFDGHSTRAQRLAALAQAQVGDLIFIPGHVMMVIGHLDGRTFVIHDTPGVRISDANGKPQSYPLDGVSVTPLEPLRADAQRDFIDIMLALQHVMPK